MIRGPLRATAIAIAALAAIDPPVVVSGRERPRLAVVVQQGPSMALPAGRAETRSDVSRRVRNRLVADLRADYQVVDGFDATADAVVVVGDRYPDDQLPPAMRAFTVTVATVLEPNVRIVSAVAPREAPPATAIPVDVVVEARGMRGSSFDVVARVAGAEVTRASHVAISDAERWRVTLSVVPAGPPPFTIAVSVQPNAGERTTADNSATLRVAQADALRVLFVEPRPSWTTTFVRRALEADPRFVVSALTMASPRAAVRTGDVASLARIDLDRFDCIVAGGLEKLSASDAQVLARFAEDRGGAIALLPDTQQLGAAAPLAGADLRERLLDAPTAMKADPPLRASEFLVAERPPGAASLVAALAQPDGAVVWTEARGDGVVLFSGAMDAWRYRGDAEAHFDRFWQRTIAGLALVARRPIDITFSPARVAAAERVTATVRVRRDIAERLGGAPTVRARVGTAPLRLWPAASRHEFTTTFVANRGASRVTAQVAGVEQPAAAELTLDDAPCDEPGPPLAALARAHGGMDVAPDALPALERTIRAGIRGAAARTPARPFRSPWWLLPFVACLSAEWWLRRRAGER